MSHKGSSRAFKRLSMALGLTVVSTLTAGMSRAADPTSATEAKPEKTAAKAAKPGKPPFTCTEFLGVSVTGDWFAAGFEKKAPDDRYQARTRKSAFLELWGDPKSEIWAVPLVSPCGKKSAAPDRVVLTGVNWEWKTVDQWTEGFTKAVATIKGKYPKVKRIELLTMLRAPGNKGCGSPRTIVDPMIDDAIARVAAAEPKLVKVGPKVEVKSCEVFLKDSAHFTPEGFGAVAHLYASHYATN
jgi:hypothetical protein